MNHISAAAKLDLCHQFQAPVQVVFNAWTDPAFLAQWWGPVGCTVFKCEVDLRPGGNWRFGIRTQDGDREVYGRYISVSPNKALVFTWQWDSEDGPGEETIVSVSFASDSDMTTLVTLRQEEFSSQEICDRHIQGWNSSFESLNNFFGEKQ